MKKAMLFVVAMMFSVAANAATFNLTTSDSATIFDSGTSAVSAAFGDTNTTFSLEVIGDGPAAIDFDFSPASKFSAGTLTIGTEVFAVTPDFTTILNLAAGIYSVTFDITPALGNMSFGVSAVPVPAALFLFAPALLGFLGMRRKNAVAA
ncbi:hypothetical protein GCM10025856_23440 [Methylophaga marina]|uniref:VPLPA-CTERM sorting domain-containing protein n=1 Tax=Methylophaga marina TaxID=45495 RepID=A0ABN0TLZ0_9GAMM|nr:hypothetical protein [Methylophaga marina]BDZ74625.1 hypothetical protein GCM10025856_23440 [Methylophaga marina]